MQQYVVLSLSTTLMWVVTLSLAPAFTPFNTIKNTVIQGPLVLGNDITPV